MANPWRRLIDLLPGNPLLTGTVQAVNGDGTVTVALHDGGTVRVTGTSAVGVRVDVQYGKVQSELPNLEAVDIEV
jgi:hypothetical protein